ncbi:MAG: hypothetical protein Kow00127_24440 [Bacteroidales bacterium]
MKNKIYLAALLHDIGKFYQRADQWIASDHTWLYLDKKRFPKSDYCPERSGGYSHIHVLWTAQFIEDILRVSQEEGPDTLQNLAARHHSPRTEMQKLIRLADHLSSGMDREQQSKKSYPKSNKEQYRRTLLLSLLSGIGRKPEELKEVREHLQLRPLEVNNIMPVEEYDPDVPEILYFGLWKEFTEEVTRLRNAVTDRDKMLRSRPFADTLLSLLQKYTANIPASTVDLPDVSLFDHSRTTAAFATALYDYIEGKNITIDEAVKEEHAPFLLVGADLSGIQNYIFDIVSKNASKNLKGRSFYLHLIATTVIRKILDESGLYEANIIYNSGGTFFLLMPNTERIHRILTETELEVQRALFNDFHGVLYLSLASVTFGCKEVFSKETGEVWNRLFGELGVRKQQRFGGLIASDWDIFFGCRGDEGERVEKDAVTGYPLHGKSVEVEGVGRVSPLTARQIRMGRKLKNCRYWLMLPPGDDAAEPDTTFLGYRHYLIENASGVSREGLPSEEHTVMVFNDSSLTADKAFGKIDAETTLFRFELYGGNTYPADEKGHPLTYDMLPAGSYGKNAIVRLDVDNLGAIFRFGFAPEQRTFSRFSQLSRSLDLFFKGYLTWLWKSDPGYRRHVVIVFAGGDDLFMLGDWQKVIEFTRTIRDDFRRFTGNNPLLTISGGIVILPPKYPVLKAAQLCGNAEELGKKYRWRDQNVFWGHLPEQEIPKTKDAVGFLGTSLAWDIEFRMIEDKARELAGLVSDNRLPSSLLHRLMDYYTQSGLEEYGEITNRRIIWLMSYDIARMARRYSRQKDFLNNLVKDCIENNWNGKPLESSNRSAIHLYALAARWAEMICRDKRADGRVPATTITDHEVINQ